ncbi:MAG: NDP-sugar synthase [Bdellovibrionales bacterium]|nr:NDP-sugar synthase [Bdellovibrionales bacterium]
MKALILTAGLGTRLAPYTHRKPKPAICMFGIPIVYYSLYLLKKINHYRVIANLHHLPHEIQALFKAQALKDFSVEYSWEKEKILGSGGAIWNAKALLEVSDNFLVINGDEVMIPSQESILNSLQDHHLRTNSLATFLVTDHPDLLKTLKPIWVDREGFVLGFGETPPAGKDARPVHFTGYKIYNRRIFNYLPQGESHIFKDAVIPALRKGERVSTLKDSCQWWETGNFNNLIHAHRDFIQIASQSPKSNPIQKIYDSFNLKFDFKVIFNDKLQTAFPSQMDVQSLRLENTVFIAPESQLHKNIVLNNVIVSPGALVTESQTQKLLF